MAEVARHLYIVDPETGEQLDECPGCSDRQLKLDELTRKYHGALAQIGRLRRDREAEARTNRLWPDALAVFRFWQERSGHAQAEFTGERFWTLEPFLRQPDGPEGCREAVLGCLASDFHMKRGPYRDRKGPVHDGFDLIFRSQEKFEAFRQMAPVERRPFRKASLLELAGDVSGRVLERAKLIEREVEKGEEGYDPGAVANLLVEIRKLIKRWLDTPDEYAVPPEERAA